MTEKLTLDIFPSGRFSWLRNLKAISAIFFLFYFCVPLLFAQGTQKDICDEDFSCASDPTYKFFEKEQKKAYCATEQGRKYLRLLRDEKASGRLGNKVDSIIDNRPNSLNTEKWDHSAVNKFLDSRKRKLSTCYEDQRIYDMIGGYMDDVERARKQLKLPLESPPIFGSLPTSEINAYTYPKITDEDVVEKRGSIIGFNTQLFMFAYLMPKITLPTIERLRDKNTDQIVSGSSKEIALKAIEQDPKISQNYTMAILSFLQLTDPYTEPLDSKYDEDLISFTTSTEIFAVAHEYGHLIKGHALTGTRSLRLNSDGNDTPVETVVGVRSWQQELEADRIGIQLLVQVLKNKVSDAKPGLDRRRAQLRQIFGMYGSLFYFKCSTIIEDAQYIRDNGTVPPEPSRDEVDYIRSIANGRSIDPINNISNITLNSHPPGWVRFEQAVKELNKYIKQGAFTEEAKQYAKLGLGLIENIELLRGITLPRTPMLISLIKNKKMPTEIGYQLSPEFWAETFLYNPALQAAIKKFSEQDTPDSIIIQFYKNAVKRDWLLLSGAQVKWAERVINTQKASDLKEALIVIALSGNKQYLPTLKRLSENSANWIREFQPLLVKTIQFLDRNGRETSIKTLADGSADEIEVTELLAFPGQLNKQFVRDSLIPEIVPENIQRFLTREGNSPDRRSLSALALFFLAARSQPIEILNFWTDLLLESNELEAALRYVKAWTSKVGPNLASENTIGNILSKKGDLREAIIHYERSIELGRLDGWPEINIAMNYSNLNELVKSEEWFRKGIDRHATVRSEDELARYLNEFSWFLITKFNSDRKRFEEALALSLLSNKLTNYLNPNYLDTLAECLFENKEFKAAINAAERAITLISADSPEYEKYKNKLNKFKSKVK